MGNYNIITACGIPGLKLRKNSIVYYKDPTTQKIKTKSGMDFTRSMSKLKKQRNKSTKEMSLDEIRKLLQEKHSNIKINGINEMNRNMVIKELQKLGYKLNDAQRTIRTIHTDRSNRIFNEKPS